MREKNKLVYGKFKKKKFITKYSLSQDFHLVGFRTVPKIRLKLPKRQSCLQLA